MADLHALIRLRQFEVDEKQKVLAALYREAEAVEVRKAALIQKISDERQIIEETNDFDMAKSFLLFVDRAREEIAAFDVKLAEINGRVAMAQELMREAYGELKKIEIIQRNRDEAERKAENARDSAIMDEIGIEGHRRKDEESSKS